MKICQLFELCCGFTPKQEDETVLSAQEGMRQTKSSGYRSIAPDFSRSFVLDIQHSALSSTEASSLFNAHKPADSLYSLVDSEAIVRFEDTGNAGVVTAPSS